MRYRAGFGAFGKGGFRPVQPAPGASSWDREKELLEMKQKHEMEMMRLRMEMAQMQRAGVAIPYGIQVAATNAEKTAGTATSAAQTQAPAEIAQLKAEIDKLKRQEQVAASGGAVVGTNKSVEELLVGKDVDSSGQKFVRSTAKAGLKWDDWRKLKVRLPADFDEQKYLEKNPDVAAGVKRGQFPSGAWHYVMYGSPNCAYGERHQGHCDKKAREFKGWRRPGYLAGIFSNWSQYD